MPNLANLDLVEDDGVTAIDTYLPARLENQIGSFVLKHATDPYLDRRISVSNKLMGTGGNRVTMKLVIPVLTAAVAADEYHDVICDITVRAPNAATAVELGEARDLLRGILRTGFMSSVIDDREGVY